MLRLQDGRVLLTFTQRCNGLGPDHNKAWGSGNGSNACHDGNLTDGYGTGLRALLSYDDGATWDFDSDYMVLSAQDDEHNPVMDGDHIPLPLKLDDSELSRSSQPRAPWISQRRFVSM